MVAGATTVSTDHLVSVAIYEQDSGCPRSSLISHAHRRWVGRRGDPEMATLLPHRDGRCREVGIGEGSDGDGNHLRKAGVFPVDGGAAHRTETER